MKLMKSEAETQYPDVCFYGNGPWFIGSNVVIGSDAYIGSGAVIEPRAYYGREKR